MNVLLCLLAVVSTTAGLPAPQQAPHSTGLSLIQLSPLHSSPSPPQSSYSLPLAAPLGPDQPLPLAPASTLPLAPAPLLPLARSSGSAVGVPQTSNDVPTSLTAVKTPSLVQVAPQTEITESSSSQQVFKNIFVYSPPPTQPVLLPPRKVHYNYVFVRTSGSSGASGRVVAPAPQQKTLVYLLSRRPTAQELVLEAPASPPTKPEVYFVNYQDGDDAALPGGVSLATALSHSTDLPSSATAPAAGLASTPFPAPVAAPGSTPFTAPVAAPGASSAFQALPPTVIAASSATGSTAPETLTNPESVPFSLGYLPPTLRK